MVLFEANKEKTLIIVYDLLVDTVINSRPFIIFDCLNGRVQTLTLMPACF